MPEILEVGSAESFAQLPEIVPWSENVLNGVPIDLLICCAGFEDRSTAFVAAFRRIAVKRVAVIRYPTNPTENVSPLAGDIPSENWGQCEEWQYDRTEFLKDIRQKLWQMRGEDVRRVVVDLSGMASYVLYRLLTAVCDELPGAYLGVYYAEAENYSPSRQEWEEFYKTVPEPRDNLAIAERYEETLFQSSGIDDTYESDVFPGSNIGPLATEVVAFPSFSLQRMKSILAYTESQYNVRPSDIRWFVGQPPDRARNGWRYDALSALYNVGESSIGVSTRDYREALRRLDGLWQSTYAERHLVLAPLGSKMQHLGCFIFLRLHKECGLLLCEPKEVLPKKYSAGVGPCWWLDFGLIEQLDGLLARRGTLDFRWSAVQ